MLKGCQRRIIMIKDTGSRCFDAAYFVLRHDAPDQATEADMLTEASRVIDACSVAGYLAGSQGESRVPPRRRGSVMLLIAAAGLGLVAGAAATLLCCLA